MQFEHPQALWLLLLIPIFILFFLFNVSWKKRATKKIGDAVLVKHLTADYSSSKYLLKFIFIVLAFALGCIALANPRSSTTQYAENRSGIDVVIALDVSNSMLAIDAGESRLDLSKQMLHRLLQQMQDNRIALIVFAGNAYVQLPLTFDYAAARMLVDAANPAMVTAQGTAVGEALKKTELIFNDDSPRFKAVVLISDGETHDEEAIEKAKALAEKGAAIYTIGVGSLTGATIIDAAGQPKKDAAGNVVITQLNEEFLKEISGITNGSYIYLTNAEAAADELLQQLAVIETTALPDPSQIEFQMFYHWLLIPVLLLLLIEIFISDKKRSKA